MPRSRSEDKEMKRRLLERLTPLFIANFFQSFVLWYSVEKLFMHSIGFNNSTIGFMVAVYSFVMLAVNSPSGILADRWSRKGVLVLASVSLTLSCLIGGLSHNVVEYLICAIFWGIFFACYSGMYDSIIYDVIAETKAPTKLFEYFYGRCQAVEGASLVTAGLLGGLVAGQLSLRATYFISVPLGFVSIWALIRFREPRLHKDHEPMTIRQQITASFHAVLQNRALLPVLVVLVLEAVLVFSMYEFGQLWLIALHLRTGYFGIANAILLSSLAAGGYSVDRLRINRYYATVGILLALIGSCLLLIISRNVVVVILSQLVYAASLINIAVIFNRILHDNVSPAIRAGASSVASTLGRFLLVPVALVIGYWSQRYSIYKAAYLLLLMALIMGISVLIVANRSNRKGLDAEVSR